MDTKRETEAGEGQKRERHMYCRTKCMLICILYAHESTPDTCSLRFGVCMGAEGAPVQRAMTALLSRVPTLLLFSFPSPLPSYPL